MPKFKNSNATFWVIFKHCAGTGHQIQGEIYQIDDLLLKILDDFEGHPNYYLRREESVMHLSTDAAKAEKCWTYFLPKFKVELLELQFLSDYR